MKKILCNWGFHDWSKWELMEGTRQIPWFKSEDTLVQVKTCINCGKVEVESL